MGVIYLARRPKVEFEERRSMANYLLESVFTEEHTVAGKHTGPYAQSYATWWGASPLASASDNVEYINAALANGGTVIVPGGGTYTIDDTLLIPDDTTLIVERGATIALSDNADVPLVTNSDLVGGNSNISIIGPGTLDGNGENQAWAVGNNVITFENVTNFKIANLKITKGRDDNIQIESSANGKIINNESSYSYNYGSGIYVTSCNYITISGNYSHHNGVSNADLTTNFGDGIRVEECTNITVDRNIVRYNNRIGIVVEETADGTDLVSVTGNVCEENGKYSGQNVAEIWVECNGAVTVTGNICFPSSTATEYVSGIKASTGIAGRGVTITGNTVYGNDNVKQGIDAKSNCVVSGNTIQRIKRNDGCGVFISAYNSDIYNLIISDNVIFDVKQSGVRLFSQENDFYNVSITKNVISNVGQGTNNTLLDSGIVVHDVGGDAILYRSIIEGNIITDYQETPTMYHGIYTGDAVDVVVRNNFIDETTSIGLYMTGTVDQCTIDGNTVKNAGTIGMSIAKTFKFSQCTNNKVINPSTYGVYFFCDVNMSRISGNIVTGATTGIRFQAFGGTYGTTYSTIADNICSNNSAEGIFFICGAWAGQNRHVKYCNIIGNNCSDNQGTPTQDFGIKFEAVDNDLYADYNNITGNICVGNTDANMSVREGTNGVLANNIAP